MERGVGWDTAEKHLGSLVPGLLWGTPTPPHVPCPWSLLPAASHPQGWEMRSDLEEQRQRQREAGRAADAVAHQQEAPSPQTFNGACLEQKRGQWSDSVAQGAPRNSWTGATAPSSSPSLSALSYTF